MKTIPIGHIHRISAAAKRPVICSDRGEVMVAGTGEPTYGVCENCRRLRGIKAAQERLYINRAFDPNCSYRRKRR